ncbi:MAG TPA: hypothetical protein VIF62_09565 [Labilithrix sp.]
MRAGIFCTILAVALGVSSAAQAAVCGSDGHPVVYIVGTGKAYVAALAKPLYTDPNPITLAWIGTGSCTAVSGILTDQPIAPLVQTNPATGSAFIFPPSATGDVTCTIPALDAGTVLMDIAASDVFATTCGNLPNGLPPDLGDFFGPVQPMGFIVPKASHQTSISATAAYFLYGLGAAAGNIAPWTDDGFIYKRVASSGTVQLISAGIGVPADKWHGSLPPNGGLDKDMAAVVSGSAQPEKTIGVLAMPFLNTDPNLPLQLSVLAYKHYGQQCAYYPDSTPTSRDKANVRDGHYALWGPVHFLAKLDSNGNIRNPNAKRVVDYLTQVTPPPGKIDLIQFDAQNYLVPSCAMKVKRATEIGPMTPFAPPNACGCYYEQVGTGATSCKACTGNQDCDKQKPVCSYGFCEAQ